MGKIQHKVNLVARIIKYRMAGFVFATSRKAGHSLPKTNCWRKASRTRSPCSWTMHTKWRKSPRRSETSNIWRATIRSPGCPTACWRCNAGNSRSTTNRKYRCGMAVSSRPTHLSSRPAASAKMNCRLVAQYRAPSGHAGISLPRLVGNAQARSAVARAVQEPTQERRPLLGAGDRIPHRQ